MSHPVWMPAPTATVDGAWALTPDIVLYIWSDGSWTVGPWR